MRCWWRCIVRGWIWCRRRNNVRLRGSRAWRKSRRNSQQNQSRHQDDWPQLSERRRQQTFSLGQYTWRRKLICPQSLCTVLCKNKADCPIDTSFRYSLYKTLHVILCEGLEFGCPPFSFFKKAVNILSEAYEKFSASKIYDVVEAGIWSNCRSAAWLFVHCAWVPSQQNAQCALHQKLVLSNIY